MSERYRRAIHWFRRDLRLTDNTGLMEAIACSDELIPCYIISDWHEQHAWTSAKRQQFLCDCLNSLAANVDHLGGCLVFRRGPQVKELLSLVEESKAEAIFLNRDVDPYGQMIEEELRQKSPVPVHFFDDCYLHRPGEVLKGDGSPYRVYTPFSKRWLPLEKRGPVGRPSSFNSPTGLKSRPPPDLSLWNLKSEDHWELLPGGEKAARHRMKLALSERIPSYNDQRDLPAVEGTSRLSQDLRWGTLSIRELYQRAITSGSVQFLKELAWREFYFQILKHFPEVLSEEFNPDWRGLPWDEPGEAFDAWKAGKTGFPIVDAGIRQLLSTGFMHNRVRMIVAMFLTKDLHIDWRLGEQFFAQHLLDGEIASNNGGWQWSAGTGADAAPYFRIQNPWSQTKRYDPQGEYIKRWIPELSQVDSKRFQAPPEDGRALAEGYPLPIVDHGAERLRTLDIFKKHKAAKAGH